MLRTITDTTLAGTFRLECHRLGAGMRQLGDHGESAAGPLDGASSTS